MKNAGTKRICGYPRLGLMAVMLIATTSCSIPLRDTDLVPTIHTIPHSSILEYIPLDISRIQIVHVQAVLPGRSSDENAVFRNYVLSHVGKFGSWKVSDNIKETAAACGNEGAESIHQLGRTNCQFLLVEIYVVYRQSVDFFRISATQYPESNRVLHAQGRMSFLSSIWSTGRDLGPLLGFLKKWHDDSLVPSDHTQLPHEYAVSNDHRDFVLNARTVGVVVVESKFYERLPLPGYVKAELSQETSLEASRHLGEESVRILTEYGYDASVLTVDDELRTLLDQYSSIRGDIAVQSFPTTQGLVSTLAPFAVAAAIMKKHGLDALILAGAKETFNTRNIWKVPVLDGEYFDFALFDKSGRLILYTPHRGMGSELVDSIASVCNWYVMQIIFMTD